MGGWAAPVGWEPQPEGGRAPRAEVGRGGSLGGREAILASSPFPHAGPGRTPSASGWESPLGRGWGKDWTGWEETGLGEVGLRKKGCYPGWAPGEEASDSWRGPEVLAGEEAACVCGRARPLCVTMCVLARLPPAVVCTAGDVCESPRAHTCAHSCERSGLAAPRLPSLGPAGASIPPLADA